MIKDKSGFAHILLVIVAVVVIGAIGFATKMVLENKTTLLDGGYKWSAMDKGPYNDKVMYTTSPDPYTWQGQGTLLSEHASVPDVMYRDGKLFVYFVDVSVDGKPEQIGIKTSEDKGKTWSETQFAKFENVGDKVPVDPAPILLEDGRVRMYYYDIGRAGANKLKSHSIYSAISDDGFTFKQEDGVRFTYDDIYDPDVIKNEDGWRMYVGTGDQKVLTATSKDGLSFEYEGVAYQGGAIPNVILEEDTYILYTGGIQIATSKDGKTFTKTPKMFNSGGVTADPGVVKLEDGLYFMAFKTSSKQPEGAPSGSVQTQPAQSSPNSQPTQPPVDGQPKQPPQNQPASPPKDGQALDPVDPNLPQQSPATQ